MSTLDLKAIAWFEDMYQKLEANTVPIYQDSIKYVENQVETVGACVEKFYADLVQNALPLLPNDPVGPESPRLQSVHCADNGIVDKAELDISGKQVTGGNENFSSDSYPASELDEYIDDRVSSGSCDLSNTCEQLPQESTTEELNLCNEDNSEDQSLPSQKSALKATPVDGDCTDEEGKLCTEMDECHEVVECVASTEVSTTKVLTLCNKDNSEDQSLPSQKSVLKATPTDGDCTTGEGKLCTEMDECHGVDECVASTSAISSSLSPTVGDEFGNGKDMSKRPYGMSCKQVRDEIEQQLDEIKLDKSCVLFDKHEHLSVSHLDGKQGSYKKKIRNIFYPRRWSRRENQEQLNTWNEDTDTCSNQECRKIMVATSTLDSCNTNLQINSLESGWEIL